MRQNILASKVRAEDEDESLLEEQETIRGSRHALEYDEPEEDYPHAVPARRDRFTASDRFSPPDRHAERVAQPHLPSTRELLPEDQDEGEWQDYEGMAPEYSDDVDPDLGYDEDYDGPLAAPGRSGYVSPVAHNIREVPTRSSRRHVYVEPQEEYEDQYDDDYYEEEPPTIRPRRKKRKVSRRGLLLGIGAAAVGGAAVTAVELAPRIPQAVSGAEANIQREIEAAFNRGLAQGADTVRREFVTSLENLEGVSLQGAEAAARLTRMAYDVFVSPVIKFGSAVTSDFLGGMLTAFKAGRHILAVVNQDNATLGAIQSVLESWTTQVKNMPKQLDAITETDLDGAQAYLRSLQRKLDDEKAKLNNSGKKST